MESIKCKVLFTVYKPKDLENMPYLIWVSHGVHTHIVPPPTKTPDKYLDEILGVVRRINDPSLSSGNIFQIH